MKKFIVMLILIVICSTSFGLTYDGAYYIKNMQSALSGSKAHDPIYLALNEIENSFVDTPALTSLSILESTGATYWSKFIGGNQSANLTYTLPTAYPGSSGYVLTSTTAGVLSWSAVGATTVTDLDTAYNGGNTIDVDGSAVTLTVSDTDNNPALTLVQNDTTNNPKNLTITNAGTGNSIDVQGLAAGKDIEGTDDTWNVTGAGAATFTGVSTSTLGTTGATTLGNGTSTVAINTSSWDISSVGAISGVTTLAMSDDLTFATAKGIKSSTTTAQTVGMYGYDVDGAAYLGSVVITNGNTVNVVIGGATGTAEVSTTTWDVSSAGVVSGVTGLTVAGTTSINDTASTATTSIGGGTTTGTVSIATGASAQTVNLATGAGVKATTLGSTNTTASTVVQSGTGDVSITSTDAITMTSAGAFNIAANAVAQLVAIGNETGASSLVLKAGTGNITIDGVAATTITVGDSAQTGTMKFAESSATVQVDVATGTGAHTVHLADGAGAQTVTVGSTNTTSATTIQSGTGDMTISSVDDLTVNGGSAGSIINFGTNTHGNVINIATDDTAADTISIGSAKDNTDVLGSVLIPKLNFAADAEISDTYVITLSPAATAYSAGMMIVFTATTANTGACTINVNGLGAKALKSL
ncbi:MAG: hypothetical protein WCY05_03680, partial [Candidatus Omnitrophota bacterium]